MKRNTLFLAAGVLLSGTVSALVVAQERFRGRRAGYGADRRRGVQDLSIDRNGVPTWDVGPAFKTDVYTFVRVRYGSGYGGRGRGGGGWATDYPDSDLNFSFRLQQ